MSSSMTASEAAAFLNGSVFGDGSTVIRDVAKIEDAGPSDLTFIANVKYLRYLSETKAGVILVSKGAVDRKSDGQTFIEVEDPYLSFLRLLEVFHPRNLWLEKSVHSTAIIADDAVLGSDVSVGAYVHVGSRSSVGARCIIYPHAVIAADVVIGEDCEIHSHVSIREGVRIGNRVVVQNGAVIGADGFGFAQHQAGYRKIPQMGIVVIEDDVEIGANTTVDRATLGETRIMRGTKLDNLIQIAHNVTIGSDTVIAAQSGISGSTKIGDQCRIGGQVGIIGHLRIGDRVMIGAQSGIGGDIADNEVVSGSPSRPHSLWKRIEASLTRLPELFKRVRTLEMKVLGDNDSKKASQ